MLFKKATDFLKGKKAETPVKTEKKEDLKKTVETAGIGVRYSATNRDMRMSEEATQAQEDFFFMFESPPITSKFHRINFNQDVHPGSVDSCIDAIEQAGMYLSQMGQVNPTTRESAHIEMKVTTPGGEIISGYRLIDAMESAPFPIHTIATGTVASMGIPLLVTGEKRYATKNAIFLIHQLSGGVGGKYKDIYDHLKLIEILQQKLNQTIVKRSNLSLEQIKSLMDGETWFDSKQALKYGLIDEIL